MAHMPTLARLAPAAQTANCSDASILVINVNVQIDGHSYRLKTTTVGNAITVGKTTTVGNDSREKVAHMPTLACSAPAVQTANCSYASILVINVNVQIYGHRYRLETTTVGKTTTVGETITVGNDLRRKVVHMRTLACSAPAAQTANCSDASILIINVNVQIDAHSYRLKTSRVGKTITVGKTTTVGNDSREKVGHVPTLASSAPAAQTANCSDALILVINVNVQFYGHSYRQHMKIEGEHLNIPP